MHVVNLSTEVRSHLARQLAYSHNTGTGFLCAYLLSTPDKTVSDVATLMVFPGASDTLVMAYLFGDQSSTTLPSRALTPEQIGELLNQQANAAPNRANYPTELQVHNDVVSSLRLAIKLKEGAFLLPTGGKADLHLMLERTQPLGDRSTFRYVLNGASKTMAALLPVNEGVALQLLVAVAADIVGAPGGDRS